MQIVTLVFLKTLSFALAVAFLLLILNMLCKSAQFSALRLSLVAG